MFQVLFLILGLLSIVSGLSEGESIQGSLLIKQNKADESTQGSSFKVRAAINSPQYNNILHQAIQVIVPSPTTACRPAQIPESFNGFSGKHPPIYFLVSGEEDCSYARKVQNAKKGLAKGVIIVDSPKGINNLKLRLNEKDLFVTLLISESDGSKLIKSTSFIGELTMGDRGKDRKNEMEIWVSSLNGESYRILNQWSGVLAEMKILQKQVTWTPRFAFYSCGSNAACDKSNYVSSCACGGEFCSPEQHGSTSNVLVREDIRQHLIFKQYPEKYLQYVKRFSETCYQGYSKTLISDDCASGIMHELQLDGKINTKIDSFLSSCDEQDDEVVFQLYKVLSLDRAKYSQIGHYPTVILNHEQLQFRNQEEFKNAVCRKLSLDQQSGCGIVIESTTIFSKIVSAFFYFMMVTLLLGAGAFVVLFFRNKLRREMNKELKMQVSTAVEHYFTLSEAQH